MVFRLTLYQNLPPISASNITSKKCVAGAPELSRREREETASVDPDAWRIERNRNPFTLNISYDYGFASAMRKMSENLQFKASCLSFLYYCRMLPWVHHTS